MAHETTPWEEALWAAMQLDISGRARLARELLDSLHEEDSKIAKPDALEQALAEEAQGRFDRLVAGNVQGIPWEVVRNRLKIGKKKL